MYRTQKYKQKQHSQQKATSATVKGKMTLETLEPDYSTRLLAAGPVSPTDSLLQFPMDLVSPVAVASEDLLSKFSYSAVLDLHAFF